MHLATKTLFAALSALLAVSLLQPVQAHGGGGGGGGGGGVRVLGRFLANPFVCGPDASAGYTRKNGSLTILAQTFDGDPSEAGVHVSCPTGTIFEQLNFAIQGDYTGNSAPRVRWTFADSSTFTGNAFITNIGPVRRDGFRVVSLYSASYPAITAKFNTVPVTEIDILYTNNTDPHTGWFTGVRVNGVGAASLQGTLTCP